MRLCAAALIVLAPLAAAFAGDAAPAQQPAAAPSAEKPAAEKPVAKPAGKKESKPASGALKSDDDKTVYLLGYILGNKTAPLKLSPAEAKLAELGFKDGAEGKKPAVDPDVYGPKINDLAMARTKKEREAAEAEEKHASEKRKAEEKAFLEKAAKEPGAKAYPSGLIMTVEKEATGAQPKPEDTVKVNYEGKFVDGTVFDSSYKRGEPATFPLNGVIKCWTEGVAKMKVGGKAKLVCPPDIAYGDFGRPPSMPGGATLIFEVELLDIVKNK